MRQVIAKVIKHQQVLPEFRRPHARAYLGARIISLGCPEIAREAKPGQFVMLRCGEACILPRPFSIHQVTDTGIAIFYAVLEEGRGTNWLSKQKRGDTVKLFGPLGNGFNIYPTSHKLLLAAGGNGIAPLYFLARRACEQGYSITLLYGAVNKNRHILNLPKEIEVVAATEDGSVGMKGLITDILPDFISQPDQIFACGPLPMYKAMAKMPELRNRPVQVSLEVRMGCGLGACYGCTIKTKNDLKQVCKDGPVFNLDDILWDKLEDV